MASINQTVGTVTDRMEHVIGDHPLNSAATAFGLGLGVGLLAVLLLPSPVQSRREALTERLLETMSHIVPDSVARRMS